MYLQDFDSSLLQCAMECAFKKENLVSKNASSVTHPSTPSARLLQGNDQCLPLLTLPFAYLLTYSMEQSPS
jgi:hypothetical protein